MRSPLLGSLFLSMLVAGGVWSIPEAAAQAAAPFTGDRSPYYFYRGPRDGSDSLISPWRLIINGGFGILQMESRSNRLADVDYANGWRNVWKNLRNPVASIDNLGWWKFFSREIIPISIDSGNAQYWPNYTNHLIGGGMSYRMMREWFRWHGFAHEVPWALATLTVYHLLNETVEMDDKVGWRVDPVADFYIFNVAGVLLFNSDWACQFFSQRLHLTDWSFPSFYDPRRGALENVGQNYMMRLRLGRQTPWYLFYHWGNGGELGATRHLGRGHHVSAGGGFVAKDLLNVDGISETVNLATTFGLFYDRHGSLLTSLLYTQDKQYRWRLNVYPGLARLGPLRPGVTFIVTRNKELMVGLTVASKWLPTGLGARIGHQR